MKVLGDDEDGFASAGMEAVVRSQRRTAFGVRFEEGLPTRLRSGREELRRPCWIPSLSHHYLIIRMMNYQLSGAPRCIMIVKESQRFGRFLGIATSGRTDTALAAGSCE